MMRALSALEISSGDLDPNFSSVTTMYDVSVANDVESVMVTPTATDGDGASITVDTNTVVSGNASGAITLAEGETTEIKIKVIAADMMTSMTYTVSVARAASSDATLSALGISEGALDPDFEKDTDMYEVVVRSGLEVIRVTPTASDAGASITVDTNTVESGSASGDITLTEGGTTEIKIKVVAADEITSMTYTVSVERIANDDARLSNLGISSGDLDPNFSSETTMYGVSVANNVANVTVTPTVRDSDASITVDSSMVASGSASDAITLTEGSTTTIMIKVIAADTMTSMTYTVSVGRAASSDATLSRLILAEIDGSVIAFNKNFASDQTTYTASVMHDVTMVSVTPTATQGGAATIKIGTATVNSGEKINITLADPGEVTEISIVVTAPNSKTMETYMISITRMVAAGIRIRAKVFLEGPLQQ